MSRPTDDRSPTDAEIEAVLRAIDRISPFVNPADGTINAAGWKEVHTALATLSEYELSLGFYHLEDAMFEGGDTTTIAQSTLYELFRIAYFEGLDAIQEG